MTLAPGFEVVDAVLDPEYNVLRWTLEYHALAADAREAHG
jgi:hypothetical protein